VRGDNFFRRQINKRFNRFDSCAAAPARSFYILTAHIIIIHSRKRRVTSRRGSPQQYIHCCYIPIYYILYYYCSIICLLGGWLFDFFFFLSNNIRVDVPLLIGGLTCLVVVQITYDRTDVVVVSFKNHASVPTGGNDSRRRYGIFLIGGVIHVLCIVGVPHTTRIRTGIVRIKKK